MLVVLALWPRPAHAQDGGGCSPDAAALTPCDDGDPCTDYDRCVQGVCQGIPKDCNDGEECTTDACDPASGVCTHTPVPDGTGCLQNDFCSGGYTCLAGQCQGGTTITICDDNNACTSDGYCNADYGCEPSANVPIDCSDGNPCTDDLCDPVTGCYHVANDCGASGAGGTAYDAGATAEAGDHAAGNAGAAGVPGNGAATAGSGDRAGCACRSAGGGPRLPGFAAGALALVLVVARRRRGRAAARRAA